MSRYALSKAIALIVGFFCLLIAYNSNKNQPHSIQGLAYGTSWSVTSGKFIADHHEKNIIKIIDRIDYVASNYKEDSEIALVNFNNNSEDITVSSDLYEILTIAKEVEIKSDGYYDITLGKLSSARGFSPSFNASLEVSDNNDYKLTNINTLSKSSSFWFDLSSIAKGYAVQKIHDYLMENNIKDHLIDIGGEVIVNGLIKSNQWKVGIQHPKSSLDSSLRVIENLDGRFLAIATSGEYRNFKVDSNGETVSHTINPLTLGSVGGSVLSVTVVHEYSSTLADAYATAFNAMGYPLSLEKANLNNIALMLIVQNENDLEFIYSDKWYDLKL